MTEEEARLRLAVDPPRSEFSFWTIVMVEGDGTTWFLMRDASYTSAVQKFETFEPCKQMAPEIPMISFGSRKDAEKVCGGWNRLTEKDGEDKAFVVVKAVRRLELE